MLRGVGCEVVELVQVAAEVDELHARRRAVDDAASHVRVGAVGHVEVHVALFEARPRLGLEVAGEALPRELSGGGRRYAHDLEDRRHEVDHAPLHRDVVRRHPGHIEDERDAHERLPDLPPVLERDAVLAEGLAVVARHDDDRVLTPGLRGRVVEEAADLLVGEPDLAVVRGLQLPAVAASPGR